MDFKTKKIFDFKDKYSHNNQFKEMSELITHFFKLKKSNISVMPYLLEDNNRPKKNSKNVKKKICIVGRLAPSKGHEELLHSFANYLNIHKNIELLIVGDGPEEKKP